MPKTLLNLSTLLLLGWGAACAPEADPPGSDQTFGDEVEDAAEDAEDAANEAADEVKDAADEVEGELDDEVDDDL